MNQPPVILPLAAPACSHAAWRNGIHREANGETTYCTKDRRFVLRTTEENGGLKPVWVFESTRPSADSPVEADLPRSVLPSSVSSDFRSTFGWAELEAAAARIVKVCSGRGDTFDVAFRMRDMRDDFERDGFAALVAQGLLVQPNLEGRGGPSLFCVSEDFISKLKLKDAGTDNQGSAQPNDAANGNQIPPAERVMRGVREYAEEMDVSIQVTAGMYRTNAGRGRLVVKALNEGGCNCTEVDLLELLSWVKDNMSDVWTSI